MTPLLFLGVALAGGAGAVLRYLADLGVAKHAGRRFPWGILLVNITGSFALGAIITALPDAGLILGVGLLGGYTTFSTAMLDTVTLWREGDRLAAAINAVGMLLLSIAAAALGMALGSLV